MPGQAVVSFSMGTRQANYTGFVLFMKVRVDSSSGLLACTHGEDNGRSAGHGVTAGIHAVAGGHVVLVDNEAALLVRLDDNRCETVPGGVGNYQQSNTKQNGELITQAVSNEQIFNIWNNPQKRILGKY